MSQGLKVWGGGGGYTVEAKNLAGQVVRVGGHMPPLLLPPWFQHAREVNLVSRCQLLLLVQGQPLGFDTKYLAMADRNLQAIFSLKMVWES